jgi:hypothetical protein
VVDEKKGLGSKIDWHDWEMVGADLRRQGPGENGAPVKLTPGTDAMIFLNNFAEKFGEEIGVFGSK